MHAYDHTAVEYSPCVCIQCDTHLMIVLARKDFKPHSENVETHKHYSTGTAHPLPVSRMAAEMIGPCSEHTLCHSVFPLQIVKASERCLAPYPMLPGVGPVSWANSLWVLSLFAAYIACAHEHHLHEARVVLLTEHKCVI